MLRRLKNTSSLQWLCVGDFNEIVLEEEELRGAKRPVRQMIKFREVITKCYLSELQVSGLKYTWSRGKGKSVILEKLDKRLANESWLQLFPDS